MTRIALCATVLLLALSLGGQEPQKPNAAEEMLQAYIEAAKPVAAHERLQTLVGNWNVTTRLWFGPDEPPVAGGGTATGRMILGGRFLQLESTVDKPIEGESLSILGFDRRTNDYTLVGFDTLGTYYITAAGKFLERDEAVVLTGSYAQPPNGTEQKYRFLWKTPSPSEHLLQLYFATGPGREMLVAETRFRRAR